ncbi:hypothetical protein [Klebsiella quasipneumoniae]|uniref:hypothetical protein n=1 Tax=Klebsiella quasipneumoniae TaxID=1463165 RepID=UPI000E2D7F5E|nr:hypothetical protein [Klebsiella quasipneumoniae]HDT5858743.1 hypothetical protein [Klebsiella quasipneumoniae subsp. similipneumoniae]MBC5182682.1 hypothetical protein [Klebsiella quasipneumoniae]MCW9408715.1 hypothetical protein [Klebsiella quasipneumoniae]SXD22849.1 Uncharacterised protein [Klebsiella quasipneumoniae]HDG7890730.1 hypothetical protein [Klebsiella quasipneumoniae]
MNCLEICKLIDNELIKKFGSLYKASKALQLPRTTLHHLRDQPSLALAFRVAQAAGITLKVEVI